MGFAKILCELFTITAAWYAHHSCVSFEASMKVTVTKLNEAVVRKSYPIAGRVPGWFFRCEEQSNNVWHAEGTDLWGRRVGTTDSDYDGVLEWYIKAAEEINAQLAGAQGA